MAQGKGKIVPMLAAALAVAVAAGGCGSDEGGEATRSLAPASPP